MEKKILFIFGTRPEAIKMAPLIKEFQKYTKQFNTIVCVTAQHREMLDQVLALFSIVPDYDLNIMKPGQDLYDVTSKILLGIREILKEVKPDVVLVHGDTSTSTSAALGAFYQQIPVAHIEAGLRTYDIYNPWPEEMNRQITGRISTYHFVPTTLGKQNLLAEGIKEEKIYITGNTGIDALHWVIKKINRDQILDETIINHLIKCGLTLKKIEAWRSSSQYLNGKVAIPNVTESRKLVLITGHRRENFGEGFINICHAIKELAKKYPDLDFVYPMHLNPNVRVAIEQVFGKQIIDKKVKSQQSTNTIFIEPLDYPPFVYLMNMSFIILTDSGGIQEEAPSLGKPVLVMRNTTERPEALTANRVKLVGTDKHRIISEFSNLIRESETSGLYLKHAVSPYGDGMACERILRIFSNIFHI